jgi:hypothetical protein
VNNDLQLHKQQPPILDFIDMLGEKLSYTLAFLLLVPRVFAQEPPQAPPQPAVVSENAHQQQQNEKIPSPPSANPLNFEGVVIQAMPLEVKSMSGDIRQFFPEEKEATIARLKTGDLVKLSSPGFHRSNAAIDQLLFRTAMFKFMGNEA